MKITHRGFVWLPILIIVLGVLVVSGGAYAYLQTRHTPASINLSNFEPVASSTPQITQTQDTATTSFNSDDLFTASPASGIAGQTAITFSSSYGGQAVTSGYFIDFGDNSEALFACGESIPRLGAVNEACLPATVQHTYVGAGARSTNVDANEPQPVMYTATLHRIDTASFNDSPVVGTATITVSGWNTLPPPTCTLTASPNTAAVGQKIMISWVTQNTYSEGPSGYGGWVGLGGDGDLLEQMISPTNFSGSQTITAKSVGNQTLGLDINGPGGNGEGACSVPVTVTQ